MIQVALAISDERGKQLLYQCPHRQNDAVLLGDLLDDFEVFEVISRFASRLECMLDHGRTPQVDETVLSQAATQHFQDDVGCYAGLCAQHECFRDGLDDEGDEHLITGFHDLTGATRAAVRNRFPKDGKEGLCPLEILLASADHNGERGGLCPLLASAHWGVERSHTI